MFGTQLTNLGNALPKYIFGFTNTFRYKDLTLSVLIDGVQGNKVYDETPDGKLKTSLVITTKGAAVLNRWKAQGNISDVPRALANGTNSMPLMRRYYCRARYLPCMLKTDLLYACGNATLSYNVNQEIIKNRSVCRGLRIVCNRSKPVLSSRSTKDTILNWTVPRRVEPIIRRSTPNHAPTLYSIGIDAGVVSRSQNLYSWCECSIINFLKIIL